MENKFEEYLERFCSQRHISREEALKHVVVQYVKKSYEEK